MRGIPFCLVIVLISAAGETNQARERGPPGRRFHLRCPSVSGSQLERSDFAVVWIQDDVEQLRIEERRRKKTDAAAGNDTVEINVHSNVHEVTVSRSESPIGEGTRMVAVTSGKHRLFEWDKGNQRFVMIIRDADESDVGHWKCQIVFFRGGRGILRAESRKMLKQLNHPIRSRILENWKKSEQEENKGLSNLSVSETAKSGQENNQQQQVEQQHQLMMEDNRGKRRTKKVDGGDADEAEEQQTKKKGWLRNLLDLKKELLLNESLVVPRFSFKRDRGDETIFKRINHRSDVAYVRQDDDEVEFNRQEEWDEPPIEYDLVHRLDEALNSFKYRTRRRDQRNNAAVVKVAAFHYIFVIFVIGFSLIFAL